MPGMCFLHELRLPHRFGGVARLITHEMATTCICAAQPSHCTVVAQSSNMTTMSQRQQQHERWSEKHHQV
jgi:hypothetical protein